MHEKNSGSSLRLEIIRAIFITLALWMTSIPVRRKNGVDYMQWWKSARD
jgi:hypothetical protein